MSIGRYTPPVCNWPHNAAAAIAGLEPVSTGYSVRLGLQRRSYLLYSYIRRLLPAGCDGFHMGSIFNNVARCNACIAGLALLFRATLMVPLRTWERWWVRFSPHLLFIAPDSDYGLAIWGLLGTTILLLQMRRSKLSPKKQA